MRGGWRRLFGRLTEALPEVRHEAVLALLRAFTLLAGGVMLLVQAPSAVEDLHVPALINALLGVVALAGALAVARMTDAERARWWGRVGTVVDVAVFAAYSAAFHERPGAGGLYGVYVALVGPIRYGLVGVLATLLPVGVVASVWAQKDTSGHVLGPLQVAVVCVILAAPTVAIRSVVLRSGARLKQAEQQFATAFEHASIGMCLSDADLVVQQANRALGVLLGDTPSRLVGRSLEGAVVEGDRALLGRALRGLSPQAPSTRLEVQLQRPDGGLRWGHVSASLLEGGTGVAPRVVVQVENITERKRTEAALSHAAAHDSLTQLPNRTLVLGQLDAALQHGDQVGVLFLDLDRFKVVNDGLGHAAGDHLLVQVAARLREIMRPEDLVARQGGDEFVVLCRQADEEVAATVAGRVLESLSHPFTTQRGTEVVVGASIGIALAGPGDAADSALRDADTAMYAAKAAGGSRIRFFTPDLRDAVVQLHELEVELRSAVRNDRLAVVYQPVVELRTGVVTGCEALVRWHHPERGVIRPQDFIDVAEQSELIVELGEWVLRRAISDASTWPETDAGAAASVAVNVSLRQLMSVGFPERVAAVLDESGFDPRRLCLEVTETALASDVSSVVSTLEALRDLGLRLAIDDFGTGHASLTYLARFPVDHVKVDQSFVAGLGKDAGSAAIVGGVIAMAHTFDLSVVAEGVETASQVEILRELGCDSLQGYLLARPRDAESLSFALAPDARQALVPAPRSEGSPMLSAIQSDELERFRLLVEGAKEVTGRLDLQSVFEHAFSALQRLVDFTGGAIFLVDEGYVRIAAALPAPTPEALAARIPLGQGVSGTIAVTGEPRYLPDITIASTVTAKRRARSSSAGVRSWYGVPLIAEGHPIGVLQVDSTHVDAFDRADRLAVLAFAPVVALAVVTAQRAAAELEAIQRGDDEA